MRKAIFLLLFLSAPCFAQDKPRPFDKTDAIYWGGAVLDIVSSHGKREGNPLARDKHGNLSLSKGIALKAGAWGVFKLMEYKIPSERKAIRIAKIGAGILFASMVVRNFRIEKASYR
jgi:hypothetical protein